ncbi:hypothetical protein [Anaerotignum sp.]|uniref:hypothetical protein n=1 Tax=Anaerotignum sp. TaxID=2039241 RepID=UPI0028AB5020|nr:hypothetical protein [Anaerotignum sp.]
MKTKKVWIILVVIVCIYLFQQEPPQGMGLTNQFIGTYASEMDSQQYIVAYKDGTFYHYAQSVGLYQKGYYKEYANHTYELVGKKIEAQRIFCKDLSFEFLDGETKQKFKKINEIPVIVEAVRDLAE